MERTTETAPSSSMQVPQTIERGVGGKPRRQPPHRPPATPYARPQQNQFLRGRFLSKLVDPACRLVAGGASRIFPSLFSKHLTNDTLQPPEPQNSCGKDQISSSTFGVSKIANTSGTSDGSKAGLDFVEKRKGVDSEIKDDKHLEIEKLMEEKTFSRGEINHMIEIMNSRSADVPKVHQECKDIILSARGAKDTIGPQNLRRPTEGKQDDSNKAVWDVATPLPKPTNHCSIAFTQVIHMLAGITQKAGASEKPCNSVKNKLVLASISVSKPEQRWISTLDNSTGFTFPVSAFSGVSSEP
ncbi:Renin receptor [Gossypium arboreum]|uniref:Renin receptor n=1 Tax=Gossypium arboreum TaxID=29729 RepID=A0A0B0NPZ0_GOSAR|nr:Renin receptor [Gossypium arboreum]